MINRIVIFLVRHKLHLKKNQRFQFTGQKSGDSYYYFADTKLKKIYPAGYIADSSVSLNWLLNDMCKIRIVE